MKRCPTCQQIYIDTEFFCQNDGVALVTDGSTEETVIVRTPNFNRQPVPNQFTQNNSQPKNNLIYLLFGAVLLLSVVVVGLGVAFFYEKGKDEKVENKIALKPSEQNNNSANVETNTNKVENAPTPIQTPIPPPKPQNTVSRLKFAKGAYSAAASGEIPQGGVRTFVVKAMAGQKFYAEVSSDSQNVTSEIPSPFYDSSTNTLLKTTDYQVVVKNRGGLTRFNLKVSIY